LVGRQSWSGLLAKQSLSSGAGLFEGLAPQDWSYKGHNGLCRAFGGPSAASAALSLDQNCQNGDFD